MNEDKSWSQDFEQGYEELSAFVITIPKMPSSHHSQQSVFKGSENVNNNEFLPVCYTDLTFEAESGSIHSAPSHKSHDFFREFHL